MGSIEALNCTGFAQQDEGFSALVRKDNYVSVFAIKEHTRKKMKA